MTPAESLPYLAMIFAATVPVISVRFVSGKYLDAARDTWLLGFAWLGALTTCVLISLPLGLMACAVLLWWRSWEQIPSVMTWAGIIATWGIVQHMPRNVLEWLPIGWRVMLLILLAFAFVQRWKGYEVKATTGSRVLLAALCALLTPFLTTIPEFLCAGMAFWFTSSWIALAALTAGLAIRYPFLTPWLAVMTICVVIMFAIPWTIRNVIDRTPRGGSLDGLRMRWRTWTAMIRVTRRFPIWVTGWGPNPASRYGPSLERALAHEVVRLSAQEGNHEIATSPTHNEPLELACTYGLLGVIAMGICAWQLATRVVLGDPWSASAVAGVVLSLATIPARSASVGVVWLIVLAEVIGR